MTTTALKDQRSSLVAACIVGLAVVALGTAVAYGLRIVGASAALPVSIGIATTHVLSVVMRRHGERMDVVSGAFVWFVASLFSAIVYATAAYMQPALIPRSPISTSEYADVSKSLEDSPTPVIRARRDQILAEESRDGALDLRGYYAYFDRISTDTVDRQLGGTG